MAHRYWKRLGPTDRKSPRGTTFWRVVCVCGKRALLTPTQMYSPGHCGCRAMGKRQENLGAKLEVSLSQRLCRMCSERLPMDRYFHHEACVTVTSFEGDEYGVVEGLFSHTPRDFVSARERY